MTAEQIQEVQAKELAFRFGTALDGYFLPKPASEVFEKGEQAMVPLLAGSNSEEQGPKGIMGNQAPTAENFANAVRRLYGDRADKVLKLYPATTPEEVLQAATDLGSARFIGLGTWKWTELQMKTGKPVYRYFYAHPRPPYTTDATPSQRPKGAAHSAEIQYAIGNLDLDKRYGWDQDDYRVSQVMQAYFANFVKSGDPNGGGLPKWPANRSDTNFERMRIDVEPRAEREPERARYLVLDSIGAPAAH
jgi:para-nitrobenzyl esterase